MFKKVGALNDLSINLAEATFPQYLIESPTCSFNSATVFISTCEKAALVRITESRVNRSFIRRNFFKVKPNAQRFRRDSLSYLQQLSMRKALMDPSLWILLLGNFWCIWYFGSNPEGIGNVIWIYWLQSVIIGLVNFLDLLTLKDFNSVNFKLNNEPVTSKNSGCVGWFFLMHYGIFHFVYMIFIAVDYHKNINGKLILLVLAGFIVEAIISFKQRKEAERVASLSIGTIFFLPYLRIIPMHLTIIIPKFLDIQPTIIFLLLKTLADIGFYLLTKRLYNKALVKS